MKIAISLPTMILALVAIGVSALPLGVEAQLALAATCLLGMAAIKLMGLRGPFRTIYLGLGLFVILRYVAWRLTNTIPSITHPMDFAPAIVLVLAEAYCVTMLFLSLFTVSDPIDRPAAPRLAEADMPSVDVFVPSYNEASEILAPTLAAAKAMTYPAEKLNVFLLDDGGTDEKVHADDPDVATTAINRRRALQALSAELGVTYLTRSDNSHAKAGNLNNGLQHSDGELVVVFDADHAPARTFLTETIGHFAEDPNLFLVQTPHVFLNPDPIERNLAASRMPAENEMFYSLVQKGLDKWNAAFFCGSAAVLRRQALEQVDGFQGSSITEDAETALELHSRGWNSLYVDKPMIAGLQPETFESFIGQRARWCRGMVQILLLKNPLFKHGLTLPQRLCYASSSMFWLFPISRMIFIFAPMFYIFFNLKIYAANTQEFIAYTTSYMLAALMMQSYIFGKLRWPWISDVYEYVQSVQLFRAVLSVFIDPHRPKFNVTAKGMSLKDDRLSSIAAPYFAIFGLVVLSLGVVAYRFVHEPEARGLLTVVGIWTLLNCVLSGLALGAVSERRERRSHPRVAGSVAAELVIGAEAYAVTIDDMSLGGAQVRVPNQAQIPPRSPGSLRATLPNGQTLEVPVLAVSRRTLEAGRGIGLRFYGLNTDRFRLVAQVMFADCGQVHARRSQASLSFGVLVGSCLMVGWWMTQTVRGLSFVLFKRGQRSPAPERASSEQTAS